MIFKNCSHSTAYCIAALLALILTGGCATSPSRNPYEQYKVVQEATTPVSTDDAQAIGKTVALILRPEQAINTEITPSDPKIERDGIQSNYKIFEFQAEAHSHYTIELRSLCDCFGSDKLMLYPIARILDQHARIVDDEIAHISLSDPDWNYPVNIRMVWEGELEKSGKYFFLVSAYNENVGANYLTFEEFDLLASQIQKLPPAAAYLDLLNNVGNQSEAIRDPSAHPLWSFPTGKIVVTLTFNPN